MVAAGSLDENEEALVDCKEAHKRGGSRWQGPGECAEPFVYISRRMLGIFTTSGRPFINYA